MIEQPVFYAVAIPAVLIFAIAKGGFGGGLGVMAVPLMSLVMSPIQAAAILLPVLCLMDLMSVKIYWRQWDWQESLWLIPAAVVGIAFGAASFDHLNEHAIRLIVGAVALSFALYHYLAGNLSRHHWPRYAAAPAGATAGFTSFVAHAGGPPLNLYLLQRPLEKTRFVATTVLFFATANYVKLVPYYWLGQFDGSNLKASAVLIVPAGIGVYVGARLHKRLPERLFFQTVYALLLLVGAKLIYDGLVGLNAF